MDVLRSALDDAGVAWEQPSGDPYTFVATLPGTRKLSTTCSLRVGEHTLSNGIARTAEASDPKTLSF